MSISLDRRREVWAIKIRDLIQQLADEIAEGRTEVEFRCMIGPEKWPTAIDDAGIVGFTARPCGGGYDGDRVTICLIA